MQRIQRCSVLFWGQNDFWCHNISVDSLTSPTTWLSTSKGVLRLVPGFCDKRRQHGSTALLGTGFGQEILTVFFCLSLYHVFRFSVCNSYYASLDISTRISTSTAVRELVQNVFSIELCRKHQPGIQRAGVPPCFCHCSLEGSLCLTATVRFLGILPFQLR